jgi:hypothetical protein
MHCERCQAAENLKGYRFCKDCKSEVMAEMSQTGYLSPRPQYTQKRPDEKQENRRETIHGADENGYLANAIKVLEEG